MLAHRKKGMWGHIEKATGKKKRKGNRVCKLRREALGETKPASILI